MKNGFYKSVATVLALMRVHSKENRGWGSGSRVLVLPLTIALLSPNCGTLTRSRMQRIPVTSAPAGATIALNGAPLGVTPVEIRLDRKQKNQVIRIELPGYNPVEIRVKRKFAGGIVPGNILFGAAAGFVPAGLFGWINILKGDPFNDNSAWIWAGLTAAFGAAFTAVDMGDGSGYGLSPKDLTVTLTKADGVPRVDTLLVDAEDLLNIKWIRIHKLQ